MVRRSTVTLLILAAVLASAGDAAALAPHARDGWVLGLAYGGARGKATFADGTEGETQDGVSPQIRFGRMLGRHLALGASYGGWMYETGVNPEKHRFAMQDILLAATWYPGESRSGWGGFYVRGGAGLGWSSFTVIEMVEGEEQGHGDRRTETGPAWELGVGYEFRLVPCMSAGLGFGVNHQDIGGDIYDKSTFYPVTLSLGWYWD